MISDILGTVASWWHTDPATVGLVASLLVISPVAWLLSGDY